MWLLKRDGPSVGAPVILPSWLDDGLSTRRVRCPQCQWNPSPSSRWSCLEHRGHPEYFHGGCGTAWNTFQTRGRCPGCSYQWRFTVCLQCAQWSPHDEWYETADEK